MLKFWGRVAIIPAVIFAAIWGALVLKKAEAPSAYLYPHKEAKEAFGEYSVEGYDSVSSVAYRRASGIQNLPKRIEGVVNKRSISGHKERALFSAASPTREKMLLIGNYCPTGFEATRSDEGWVYEVYPDTKNKIHPEKIERCIGLLVSEIYQMDTRIEKYRVELKEEERDLKVSWKNVPVPAD